MLTLIAIIIHHSLQELFVDNSTFLYVAGRIPFAFLEDIHGKFVKTYGRAALTALAYAMNDEFSRVLSKQMDSNCHET